ncbi:MAG: FAD-dependent oxidoreductase, partial [Gammaproteobacteria bacterium]
MIEDLNERAGDATLGCEVAVVGAGAAGITLARRLAADGVDVCLFESGGRDFAQATQELAAGANAGMTYYDLVDARLRFFGGTTNIWGGRCSRYDAIDLERRDWVPGSGWPLEAAELERYYGVAAADFGLGPGLDDAAAWDDEVGLELGFDPATMVTRRWRFDDVAERFSAARCLHGLDAARVRVVLNANLVRIRCAPGADAVTGLEFTTLGGRRLEVTAASCVIACGGIETPRLLLAQREVEPHGIGNRHDQLGRCFMEHPHGRAGVLEAGAGFELWAAFQRRTLADGARVAPVVLPSPAVQREHGILNSAFTFKLQRDPALGLPARKRLYNRLKHQLKPTKQARSMWHGYRATRKFVQRHFRQRIARRRFARGVTRVNVMVRGEQAPNPASRVTLDDARDALGLPRARLDWRLSAIDKRTVSVFTRL